METPQTRALKALGKFEEWKRDGQREVAQMEAEEYAARELQHIGLGVSNHFGTLGEWLNEKFREAFMAGVEWAQKQPTE